MQEITEKLHKKMMEEFFPMAERLAQEGRDASEIATIFQGQLRIKIAEYYKPDTSPKLVGEVLNDILDSAKKRNADSKVESIFYQLLIKQNLDFKFQYPIGPYRADYLFSGFLVVELDGPQHEKERDERRDLYMRKMGYKIIRVPIPILIWSPNAVIDEIKEAILKEQEKK
jgi:very-short-patch-repair endonuclease